MDVILPAYIDRHIAGPAFTVSPCTPLLVCIIPYLDSIPSFRRSVLPSLSNPGHLFLAQLDIKRIEDLVILIFLPRRSSQYQFIPLLPA